MSAPYFSHSQKSKQKTMAQILTASAMSPKRQTTVINLYYSYFMRKYLFAVILFFLFTFGRLQKSTYKKKTIFSFFFETFLSLSCVGKERKVSQKKETDANQ